MRIVSDRLYGIEMRPQELALYGDRVQFSIRYAPVADDLDAPGTRHWSLLVLEISAELEEQAAALRGSRRLALLKCGWELELETPEAVPARDLGTGRAEIALLLGRVADTVNELARRAGLEAPLGPELVDGLVADVLAANPASPEP